MSFLTRVGAAVSGRVGRRSAAIRLLRPAYDLLLDCASFGRGIAWTVNGEPLRIDPRVRRFVPRIVEPEVFAVLRESVRTGETVLDIGAFLGVYTVLEARWVGPSGRVIALEPTVANQRFIRRHLRLNGVAERVTLVAAAAGAVDGTATLFLHDEPYVNRLGAPDTVSAAAGHVLTPVRSIDSLCRDLDIVPDLIRMDIQGAELDALRGARDVIRAGRDRLRIVAEMHPQHWGDGDPSERLAAVLDDLGLTATPLEAGPNGVGPDQHFLLRCASR